MGLNSLSRLIRFAAFVCVLAPVILAQSATNVSDARYAHLARGVNMDDWFEYGSPLTVGPSDVTLLKNSGFTCIRLPVAPEYILTSFLPASAVAANLTKLDAAIDLFLNAGMAVMLDFHADAQYVTYYWATPSAPQELIATWQMLAVRYANRDPELLFFEVMNEPTNLWTQAAWDTEQLQVLAGIRKIDTAHTVLVTPTNWSGLDALLSMTPYNDPNVIYVLHDYDPLTFTHQGATWVDPTTIASLRNVPYPAYLPALQTLINQTTDSGILALLQPYQAQGWDAEQIDWNIHLAAAWAKKWGVHVVANEFGSYKPYSPADSRARWLYDMRSAFEKYGIGWSMWEYEDGFDLVLGNPGSRVIDPNLAQALGFQPWTISYPAQTGAIQPFTGARSVEIDGVELGNVYAEGLIAADLNGDGAPDLVVTPINWPTLPDAPVQIFLNAGGGIMIPANFVGAPPTQQFVDVIVPGRFDRSGRMGVFLPDNGRFPAGGGGAQSKLVLPAAGNAYQDATANLPQGAFSTMGAAAADIDGDGVDDLVVFNNQGNHPQGLAVEILRNDGTGHFTGDPGAMPAELSDPTAGNRDFICGVFVPRLGSAPVVEGPQPELLRDPRRRKQVFDLAAIGWTGGTGGRLFLNDGHGNFVNGPAFPVPAGGAVSPVTGGCMAHADLNGDGLEDLIIGYQHPAANQPDSVQILINNGDGSFRDETATRIGPLPPSQIGLRRISVAAIDHGTGHALILTLVGQPPLLYADKGDGVFAAVTAWNNAGAPWVAAGADLNGDGLMDLIFAIGGAGPTVQVAFGSTVLGSSGSPLSAGAKIKGNVK
jgi:aryl-phospho-beta-D-glucosidase BglC (GH1 family)